MIDDIEKDLAQKYYPAKYTPSETEIQDLLLEELEDILSKNSQQITNFNLPQRSISHQLDITNRLIQEEMNYDIHYLKEKVWRNRPFYTGSRVVCHHLKSSGKFRSSNSVKPVVRRES